MATLVQGAPRKGQGVNPGWMVHRKALDVLEERRPRQLPARGRVGIGKRLTTARGKRLEGQQCALRVYEFAGGRRRVGSAAPRAAPRAGARPGGREREADFVARLPLIFRPSKQAEMVIRISPRGVPLIAVV